MVQALVSLALNHFLALTLVGAAGVTGGLASLFLLGLGRNQTERRIGFYVGYCSMAALLIAAIPFFCANLGYLRAVSQQSY